ncbi:cell division topological specificity factor MinE [Murimonas intestini]|uniref:Cell division topological specificity factor n=1 Tax=Murimonas intestini TaxID=1337051 RepID=A0AB73TA17_9FIRM|nr:cell division topological specificity factor MinE [Murimonas intestini]MCR1839059.1 cell division topological specificity factor MinE [Murimonas intestini]MCR1864355.1 cell division topological specificity factor MinE [Murimonas intestini]MCR1881965.1 cell division topological specificity factor MinE [Murimonas intestini]
MIGWNLFHRRNSGCIAKERLRGMLLSDRTNCSYDTMDMIKKDFRRTIEKYLEIDAKDIEVRLEIADETGQGVNNVKTIQIKGL